MLSGENSQAWIGSTETPCQRDRPLLRYDMGLTKVARPVKTIASISVVTLLRAASINGRWAATALIELNGTRSPASFPLSSPVVWPSRGAPAAGSSLVASSSAAILSVSQGSRRASSDNKREKH